MASDTTQLKRLHAELEETDRPAGPMSMVEAVAVASRLVQQRARRQRRDTPALGGAPHPVFARRTPAFGVIAAGGAAVAAGTAWLGRRRRRRQAAAAARRAAEPKVARFARGPWRRRAIAAGPEPSHAAVPSAEPRGRPPITATPPSEITDITRNFLLWVVMPIWQAAGIADWLCHRRTRIEHNAGTKESLIHLLMLAETAVPVIAGMTLEITSPMLLLMFGAVLLHSATGLWDLSYAVKKRPVTPIEQHVHSYLEMVPVMATAFVAVLHWPELRALLGFGDRPPDWTIRRKARPLPAWGVIALLAGMAVFEVLPYVEELRRTRHPDRD